MRQRRGNWIGGGAAVLAAFAAAISSAVAQPRSWASKVPPEAVKAANPAPQNAETVSAGKTIYTNACLPCHGPTAQGDGPAAEFIRPKPRALVIANKLSLPDGVMFWVIAHGVENTGMASFSDQLSETERWQAITYLHSLASAGTDVASAPVLTPLESQAAATPSVSPASGAVAAPSAAPSIPPAKQPGQRNLPASANE